MHTNAEGGRQTQVPALDFHLASNELSLFTPAYAMLVGLQASMAPRLCFPSQYSNTAISGAYCPCLHTLTQWPPLQSVF